MLDWIWADVLALEACVSGAVLCCGSEAIFASTPPRYRLEGFTLLSCSLSITGSQLLSPLKIRTSRTVHCVIVACSLPEPEDSCRGGRLQLVPALPRIHFICGDPSLLGITQRHPEENMGLLLCTVFGKVISVRFCLKFGRCCWAVSCGFRLGQK